MDPQERSTREKLIQATQQLLQEESDPESITARQITSRAGVGLGAINYHFSSKDHLLNEAVLELINQTAAPWLTAAAHQELSPRRQLRQLLLETARVASRFPKISRLPIAHTLREGSFSVPEMVVPLLREIFPGDTRDLELKLIALQLITPMQFGFLHAEAFQRYAGVDVRDPTQQEQLIEGMINILIPKEQTL